MREILLNICLTAVALCLFKMLIPETSSKKQTDFLISCFFLASLIFFFSSDTVSLGAVYGEESPQINIPYIDFDSQYADAQSKAVEGEMNRLVRRILADENIFPEEIYTIINISDKYSISINEIRLVSIKEKTDETDEVSETQLEELKKAIQIIQKEVGDSIIISGEFVE
ncbi:MAG: hypothetical protein FWF82_04505 [Oscillospiraceae bacterium]|nr:hypothetical protein [Oscillospiraceae bacterium]